MKFPGNRISNAASIRQKQDNTINTLIANTKNLWYNSAKKIKTKIMAKDQNLQFSKENLISLINESEALKVLPDVLKEKLLTSVLAKPKENQAKFKEAEAEYMKKSAKAVNETNSFWRGTIFVNQLERLHEAKNLVQSVNNDGTLAPILDNLDKQIEMESNK